MSLCICADWSRPCFHGDLRTGAKERLTQENGDVWNKVQEEEEACDINKILLGPPFFFLGNSSCGSTLTSYLACTFNSTLEVKQPGAGLSYWSNGLPSWAGHRCPVTSWGGKNVSHLKTPFQKRQIVLNTLLTWDRQMSKRCAWPVVSVHFFILNLYSKFKFNSLRYVHLTMSVASTLKCFTTLARPVFLMVWSSKRLAVALCIFIYMGLVFFFFLTHGPQLS